LGKKKATARGAKCKLHQKESKNVQSVVKPKRRGEDDKIRIAFSPPQNKSGREKKKTGARNKEG